MAKQFTYSKKERLKSRKLTEQLFKEGKSFTLFPVKVFYLKIEEPSDAPVKAGVGASGRVFKKAVDRNRIKRLLREAYRLEKAVLTDYTRSHNITVAVFLLYVDKVLPEHNLIQSKMPLAIARLIKQLDEAAKANT